MPLLADEHPPTTSLTPFLFLPIQFRFFPTLIVALPTLPGATGSGDGIATLLPVAGRSAQNGHQLITPRAAGGHFVIVPWHEVFSKHLN